MEACTWARHPDATLARLALATSAFFWLVFSGLGALFWMSLGPGPEPPLHDRVVLPDRSDFQACADPPPVTPVGMAGFCGMGIEPRQSTKVILTGCWLDRDGYEAAVRTETSKIERRNRGRDEAYASALQHRRSMLLLLALGLTGLLAVPLGCLTWVRQTRERRVVLEPRRLRIGSEAYLLESEAETRSALARLLALELDEDLSDAIERAHQGLRTALLPSEADRQALEGLRG